MTPAMLRELLRIAEARKARDLAVLEGLLAQDRALEEEIADLAGTHARDWADGAAGLVPLAQQGLRLAWADARIAQAKDRRTALAVKIAQARHAATQSLGKHSALEHLLEETEAAAGHLRAARSERDAPPALPPRE